MKFECDKSYIWLFPIFIALLFGASIVGQYAFKHPDWAFFVFPALGLFMVVSQLRSGVALDGLWRARYRKGTWQYKGLLVWNTIWAIGMSAMAIVVESQFSALARH